MIFISLILTAVFIVLVLGLIMKIVNTSRKESAKNHQRKLNSNNILKLKNNSTV